jgi:prevent-host-death family protein
MVEAKTHLADWVRTAESGRPVVITRHGKPVAALIAVEELERLRALRAAGPSMGLISVAGGWDGSEELAEILARHRRSPSRTVPELE